MSILKFLFNFQKFLLINQRLCIKWEKFKNFVDFEKIIDIMRPVLKRE